MRRNVWCSKSSSVQEGSLEFAPWRRPLVPCHLSAGNGCHKRDADTQPAPTRDFETGERNMKRALALGLTTGVVLSGGWRGVAPLAATMQTASVPSAGTRLQVPVEYYKL